MGKPDLRPKTPDHEDSDYEAVETRLDSAHSALWTAIRTISHRFNSTATEYPSGFPIDPPPETSSREDTEYFTAIAFERVIASMDSGEYGIGINEVTALEIRRINQQRELSSVSKFEAKVRGELLLGIERGDLLGFPELKGTWFLMFTGLTGGTYLAPVDKIINASLKVVRKPNPLVGERGLGPPTSRSQTARSTN